MLTQFVFGNQSLNTHPGNWHPKQNDSQTIIYIEKVLMVSKRHTHWNHWCIKKIIYAQLFISQMTVFIHLLLLGFRFIIIFIINGLTFLNFSLTQFFTNLYSKTKPLSVRTLIYDIFLHTHRIQSSRPNVLDVSHVPTHIESILCSAYTTSSPL